MACLTISHWAQEHDEDPGGVLAGRQQILSDLRRPVVPLPCVTLRVERFEIFYGPTMNAVEAAGKSGRVEELHAQLVELANSRNKSQDAGTFIPATLYARDRCALNRQGIAASKIGGWFQHRLP